MAIFRPETPEERKKREGREMRLRDERLKERPYMEYSLGDLMNEMLTVPRDSSKYQLIITELNYREKKLNEIKINPMTDLI